MNSPEKNIKLEQINSLVFTAWFCLSVLLGIWGLVAGRNEALAAAIVLVIVARTRFQRAEFLRRQKYGDIPEYKR
jgi:hypothetical protein